MADSQVSGLIEQISVDNTMHNLASTAYGICDTLAGTAAKTVEMTGFNLQKGVTVHIKFTYNNTASSPTLNINNTGAKPIVQYGTTAVSTSSSTSGWYAGAVVSFTYDGTSWVRDQGFNTDTNKYHKSGSWNGLTYTADAVNEADELKFTIPDNYGDTKNPYASKTKNYVLAAPSAADGVPSFRKLVAADIPDLSKTYLPIQYTDPDFSSATITSGVYPVASITNPVTGTKEFGGLIQFGSSTNAVNHYAAQLLISSASGAEKAVHAYIRRMTSTPGWSNSWSTLLDDKNTTAPSTVPSLSWGNESTVFTLNGTAVKIKAMEKPTYTYSDVGAAASNHTHDNYKSRIYSNNKMLSTAGWYRILDCTVSSMAFLITFYGSYNNGKPTPVTFLVSHGYSETKISQIGSSAFIGRITKIRAIHYDTSKFYIDVYYTANNNNRVDYEITPLDPNSRTNISQIDYTLITDTLTSDAECETTLESIADYATTATNLSAAPTITQAGSSGTTLSAATFYTLTVGGQTVVFKTPTDSLPTAKNDTLGGVKPWYSHTAASTGPTTGSNATAITVNAIQTTAERYYAIESDSNGRLFVNVPWTNVNNSYLTSHNNLVTQNVKTDNKKYGVILSNYETSSSTTTEAEVNRDSKVYVNPSLNSINAGQFVLHDTAATPVEKAYMVWNATDQSIDFVFN